MARARIDDAVVRRARRILLVGVTGSGKSTLARQIQARCGIPAIDVDAMAWRAGWVKTPEDELVAAAAAVAAGEEWVMDSAWAAIRPVVLPRAELIVGLDLPRWLSLGRLLRRTATRVATREPICGDNVESLRMALGPDSIIAWHFRSFASKRRHIAQWEDDPDLPPVLRLRRSKEVRAWLDVRAGSAP